MRFRVDPADIPAEKVARRLHLTAAQFEAVRPRLSMRGFPGPDPDTGMYCLEAVDRWRLQRHASLFPELPVASLPPAPLPRRRRTQEEIDRWAEEMAAACRAQEAERLRNNPELKPIRGRPGNGFKRDRSSVR